MTRKKRPRSIHLLETGGGSVESRLRWDGHPSGIWSSEERIKGALVHGVRPEERRRSTVMKGCCRAKKKGVVPIRRQQNRGEKEAVSRRDSQREKGSKSSRGHRTYRWTTPAWASSKEGSQRKKKRGRIQRQGLKTYELAPLERKLTPLCNDERRDTWKEQILSHATVESSLTTNERGGRKGP